MALRTFRANPSLGGFGGESRYGGLTPPPVRGGADPPRYGDGRDDAAGDCDAFAQIVKELVDNAVDACAHAESRTPVGNDDAGGENGTMRRVRVDIAPAAVPRTPGASDNDAGSGGEGDGEAGTRECLRVVISDNGCGMENIDDCVNAFRSHKTGAGHDKEREGGRTEEHPGRRSKETNAQKKKGGNQSSSSSAGNNGENYTSGRYGVGLTLSLLHAQRLVPGTGASITSATASSAAWTRNVYEPDADADDVVCKKRERFPKEVVGECGTTVSVYLPGGDEVERAWPRLAEYFARFQLSIDLPCSLEVKAPSLQSRPLYVRPPAEIERRMLRRRNRSLATSSRTGASDDDAGDGSDEGSHNQNWEGDDGFEEDRSIDSEGGAPRPPPSKAAKRRAEAELRRKEKLSLVHRAASTYKGRPDPKLANVAHATQPIRRGAGSSGSSPSKDGPVLEVALVVFGPEPDGGDGSDEESAHSYPRINGDRRKGKESSSTLQVVRMVNGIPLLDSLEALACGVVQKIANNATTWNSFGLQVSHKNDNESDLDPDPSNGPNNITLAINDSAQVAPFLTSGTHSMFHDEASSSNEDDFDVENNMGGKRRKERGARCILPAPLRLGDVLMVVQIRAKPSALSLPTLSKGRLPLNDTGICDALENGISDCLRCLQSSSPGLLLTAHQLKRVERDVKYAPSVANAIASVLCNSRRSGVCNNAIEAASGWDDGGTRMGMSCSGDDDDRRLRRGRARPTAGGRINDPTSSQVNSLRSMLEKRLKLVVSDEYKDANKAEERERQRMEREELAATKKRLKKNRASESDGMKSDCFESDGACSSVQSDEPGSPRGHSTSSDDFESDAMSPVANVRRNRLTGGSAAAVGNSDHSCVPGRQKNPMRSHDDQFDSDTSSPVVRGRTRRRHQKGGDNDHKHSRKDSPKSPCGETNIDASSNDVRGEFLTKEYADDEFDDGYDTSPRHAQKNNRMQQSRRPSAHSHAKVLGGNDDDMSSGSEWSSQFGEVVAGHYFR